MQRNLWLLFDLNILSTYLPILWKQKNYFEFSSTVYSRVNEVWNMILWNIIPTYHFNMRTSKQCMKYLEPSELSLHKDALSLELSFNYSMQKLAQCGWFLNLYILFFSYTKHYLQKIGYIWCPLNTYNLLQKISVQISWS